MKYSYCILNGLEAVAIKKSSSAFLSLIKTSFQKLLMEKELNIDK